MKKPSPVKICEICKKEFKKPYYDSKKNWERRRYCSYACVGEYRKTKLVSSETKEKMTQNAKARYATGEIFGFQKGHKGYKYWLGKKMSETHRKNQSIGKTGKKLSEAHIQSMRHKRYKYMKNGENISETKNYKKSENKMNDTQYKYWRREIKNRDNWKCKLLSSECKGRLESHHIFSWRDYPELRYVINNGITLCAFHHPRKWEEEKRMIPIFQELLSVSKE